LLHIITYTKHNLTYNMMACILVYHS